MALFDIKPKLVQFRDKLTEKAGALYQETKALQEQKSLKQEDAVKMVQTTIRALVLLDIADIIASLVE